MASQITSLTTVYATVHPGTNQRKIKAPRHWPLWGEFTGDRWIPRTRISIAENISIWWRHHAQLAVKKRVMSWELRLHSHNIIKSRQWCLTHICHNASSLTHRPLDKMAAVPQTVFSKAFLWMKSFVFWFKFHWNLFLRVPLTKTQPWFR